MMKISKWVSAAALWVLQAAGGPLEIAQAEYSKYCRAITGGEGPRAGFAVDATLDRAHDEYRIVSDGDGVRFVGASGRAVIYAVYDFLERRGGCAWFWDGDRVPKKPAIDCANLDVREKARFEWRCIRYFAHRSLTRFQAEQWDLEDWKREIDWLMKRRLDLFMLRIGTDDLFQKAFPDAVDYPADGFSCPEAIARSYDDRTQFWPLKARGDLRKAVLAYARERGLVHPEDCGTMTHWYSRTPLSYLEKAKPGFLPQASSGYGQKTGLVWDIREDRNVDAYFKLTETHIREYGGGTPQMFHTIGLGERLCYANRAKNHAMKLYAYDRIIEHLRRAHPDTPLLIGTWDFISTWSPAEVRELTAKLDPKNTIMLDYTSDIWDADDNFQNWDFIGRFPWIFGIFHAYEASNEIRGNYSIIRQRLPKAAADPMCKGLCFWPENSHADTLMLDYFSANAWDPSNVEINDYLEKFCARRYDAADAGRRLALWRRFLPLAEASRWGTQVGNGYRYNPCREFYPDVYFNFRGWFFGDDFKYHALHSEYYHFVERTIGPLLGAARETLETLAKEDFEKLDDMTRRDLVDIARTVTARLLEYGFARIGTEQNAYVMMREDPAKLRAEIERVRRLGLLFTKVLESSREFSLNAALEDIARHPSNPDFERTLKGNSETSYCRSHVYELAREVYAPAFAAFADWAEARLDAGDRRPWNGTMDEQEVFFRKVADDFHAKPLAEMKPDCAAALKALPETLRAIAAETDEKAKPVETVRPANWEPNRFTAVTSPTEMCAAAGRPFSFPVTYQGPKPLTLGLVGYAGKALPKGVAFDEKTGLFTGRIAEKGTHMVTFVLKDEAGRILTWGDLAIKVTEPSRRQPKTLAGETIYQLQIPGFTKDGNFAGVRKHLKRLADLGVSWIYLSPVTAADRGEDRTFWSRRQRLHGNPVNPYRPADFFHVDPDYGTAADLKALVDEAHALGLKVMTDVVFFHSGPNAVFLKEHPDWVCRDGDGGIVRNEWCFAKLNFDRAGLRAYLKDSLVRWAVDFGVDGFRADCGCQVPLDFWEDCVRTIDARKKDVVWLLEGSDVAYGTAFNIYYGFICGHGGINRVMDELFPATKIRETWQEEKNRGPAGTYYLRGTDTHDVANDDGVQRQERRWGHGRAEAALALCFALDGPTMIFQGQEMGWDEPFCVFTKTVPDWDRPAVPERAATVKRLATLKKTEPAFGAEGRLVWRTPENPEDQVLFDRVAPDGRTFRCFFDLRLGKWDIRPIGDVK